LATEKNHWPLFLIITGKFLRHQRPKRASPSAGDPVVVCWKKKYKQIKVRQRRTRDTGEFRNFFSAGHHSRDKRVESFFIFFFILQRKGEGFPLLESCRSCTGSSCYLSHALNACDRRLVFKRKK
jgi:hypothetical protein